MKQLLHYIRALMPTLLLALPVWSYGQVITSDDFDSLFIYSTSYDPADIYNKGPVSKVLLNEVADELIVKKKSDVTQQFLESVIKGVIPSAQVNWIAEDICAVIADKEAIDAQKSVLLAEDGIISLRNAYIRRVYKDLMGLYPVSQVALYGFTDEIFVQQKSNDDNDEVDALIASLGFNYISDPEYPYTPRNHRIYVTKESDIIGIANSLFESGYFNYSEPSRTRIKIVRDTNDELLDKNSLDFVYNTNGSKNYLYRSPGMFMVTKAGDTDKNEIEDIINANLPNPYYIWKADNRLQVETDEALVDNAIESLRRNEKILSANRSYFMLSEYENMLLEGTGYPNVFNYSQRLLINFKDDASNPEKENLINANKLTLEKEYEDSYGIWVAPATADVLELSRSFYESGIVEWVTLDWLTGFNVVFSGVNTNTERVIINKKEIGTNYYDLSGRKTNAPSGLTIVVTRYSDGSVKTEKRLFP